MDDRVVAKGVDMSVAFVAGQERYEDAVKDLRLFRGFVTFVSEGNLYTHFSQRPLVFRNWTKKASGPRAVTVA